MSSKSVTRHLGRQKPAKPV